jgi:hypothetical protein
VAQVALGVLLGVSLFLPWYGTQASNPNSSINGMRGDLSAWDVHPTLRWILLVGAVSTLLGAWQTIRAQKTEVPRGQITVMVAVLVAGLIVLSGLLNRPGAPVSTISLEYGWFVALAAPLGAIATGLARAPARHRAPPGAV